MRTSVYLLVFVAALLVAPHAHAAGYLSDYNGGNSSYLSDYSGGSNYYYGGHGGGYIRSGLTSGAGQIDRRGANRNDYGYVIVQQQQAHAPCGIYNRAPVNPCRQVTMAYDPDASVSRTRGGFNVPPLSSLPPYIVYYGNQIRNNWVQPVQ